jgi:hypothetical protein
MFDIYFDRHLGKRFHMFDNPDKQPHNQSDRILRSLLGRKFRSQFDIRSILRKRNMLVDIRFGRSDKLIDRHLGKRFHMFDNPDKQPHNQSDNLPDNLSGKTFRR